MQIVADLHLHSKYSRAVSKNMVPNQIARWAKIKGIDLAGTADFTHPLWFRQLQAELEEAADGVYRLRITALRQENQAVDGGSRSTVSFLLSTELSCIYSQGGRVRKIHLLVFAPSFDVVAKINNSLRSYGVNLLSDGRPIMGLTAQNLAEIILSVNPKCLIIPAHAWTPHFSIYGSNSGFDHLEECFGPFSKNIYAVETGLSSDPAMNWRIGELENRSIVSFSDAHSPAKLGREATVFELPEVSYENVRKAIMSTDYGLQTTAQGKSAVDSSRLAVDGQPKVAYTLEFYPEEGKYHFTGHRNCLIKHSPEESKKLGFICPVCGKKLTVGVAQRVKDLARLDLPSSARRAKSFNKNLTSSSVDNFGVKWVNNVNDNRPKYTMLVPLSEIIAESFSSGVSSQKVISEYEKLTNFFGSEFKILLQTNPEEIERVSGPKIKYAIIKVRSGEIHIDPGYDGVFGKVEIWKDDQSQADNSKEQMGLF